MPSHRVAETSQKYKPSKSSLPGGKEYMITEGGVATSIEGFTGKGVTGTPQFFKNYGLHKDPTAEPLPFSQPSGAKDTKLPELFFQKSKKEL